MRGMPPTGLSNRLLLTAVFSTTLGVGIIFGFEPPLISVVLSRAAHSGAAIGAVNALGLVSVILMGPFYPWLIARLGLRWSMLAGMGAAAAILPLMPLCPGLPAWMLLRFLTGCAFGLTWIASEVWMNSLSVEKSRGTVMGIYGTVFSVGTVSGPLLLEYTGTVGWQPFAVGAACLAVTVVPLALLSRTSSSRSSPPARDPQSFGKLLAFLPAAPVVMLAALVAGVVESADLSLLPVFGLRAGLNEHAALLLLAAFLAGNVVLQLPIGVLADRFGRQLMLGICAFCCGIGPLLLRACLREPALLWPLLFVWGGTLYAFYSQGIALLGEQFKSQDLAGANTLFVMVYCVGGAIGPGAGGLAMDRWPQHGLPFLLSAAALLLIGGLTIGYRRPAA